MARADNIAAEAARAAGQAIDAPSAVSGTATVVDPARAVPAAQSYLAAAHVTGTVAITADRVHITVAVTLHEDTTMLSIIGINQVTVTGHATAVLVTG